jgi:hypothetical protein
VIARLRKALELIEIRAIDVVWIVRRRSVPKRRIKRCPVERGDAERLESAWMTISTCSMGNGGDIPPPPSFQVERRERGTGESEDLGVLE